MFFLLFISYSVCVCFTYLLMDIQTDNKEMAGANLLGLLFVKVYNLPQKQMAILIPNCKKQTKKKIIHTKEI